MTAPQPALYPLRFQEILRNYGFGNRWIASEFAKSGLPAEHRLAETWEVCDRPSESSVVSNGPLAGATLHDLIARYGESVLGRAVVARGGLRFPLLIKLLDASNPLGEQIHPTDAQALTMQRQGDPGKTEAWYMLRVRPGATILCGNQPGVDRARLATALREDTVRATMREYATQPGDAFLLYAGTMHYSAGGVLFYEIMQNADITIGLRPRPDTTPAAWEARAAELTEMVHLEDSFDPHIAPVTIPVGANRRSFVFACRYFCLERLDLSAEHALDLDGERFSVLTQIEGTCAVQCGDQVETLRPGQSCLLPANLGAVRLRPQSQAAMLQAYLPDLARDVVQPLRAAGVSAERIRALGGHTRLNDLAAYLP